MELQHLKEFLCLAEKLNFSVAASLMDTTQSTLSKHIKLLEDELGVALFVRNRRSVALSDFGQYYLPYAKKIVADDKVAGRAVSEYKKQRDKRVKIAVIRNMQYYNVDKYLLDFMNSYPEYHVDLVEADEIESERMFREGKVNLFTSYHLMEEDPAEGFIPVIESCIVAVFSRSHPCALRETVRLDELAEEPLMLPSKDSRMSHIITQSFLQAGNAPRIISQSDSTACIDFAAANMGVAIQPIDLVESYHDKTVRYSDIEPPIRFYCGIRYRDFDTLSEGERAFVAYTNSVSIKKK